MWPEWKVHERVSEESEAGGGCRVRGAGLMSQGEGGTLSWR